MHQTAPNSFLVAPLFFLQVLFHLLDFAPKDFFASRRVISLLDLGLAASNLTRRPQSSLSKSTSELGAKAPTLMTLLPQWWVYNDGGAEASSEVTSESICR
jgi:hypothetical protein